MAAAIEPPGFFVVQQIRRDQEFSGMNLHKPASDSMIFRYLKFIENVYFTSTKEDASSAGCGQNGESATTFPMITSVGDTNSTNEISSARSFNSAKTCILSIKTTIRLARTSKPQKQA